MNRFNRYTQMLRTSLEDDSVDIMDDQEVAVDAGDDDDHDVEEVSFVSTEDEDVIVDTSDSAEEDVARMNEAEAEVAETSRAADEATEALEGLEALHDFVSSTQRNGGMSRQTAAAVGIAFESFRSKVANLSIDADDMPSLESFGNDSGRMQGTRLAMEGFVDFIKKIWAKVVELAKAVYRAVVNFFHRLFSATGNLKVRAERLKALKLSGEPKEKTIDTKGVAKKIAIGTSVSLNPATGLGAAVGVLEDIRGRIETNIKGIENGVKQVESGKGSLKTEQQQKMVTKPMPGNVVFEISFSKRMGLLTMMNVDKKVDNDKISDQVSMPVMSPKNINATGEYALKIVDLVNGNKDLINKIKEQHEKLSKVSLSGDKFENSSDEEKKSLRETISSVGNAVRAQTKLLTLSSSHAVNLAFTYIKLAERSAGMYDGGASVQKQDEDKASGKSKKR